MFLRWLEIYSEDSNLSDINKVISKHSPKPENPIIASIEADESLSILKSPNKEMISINCIKMNLQF